MTDEERVSRVNQHLRVARDWQAAPEHAVHETEDYLEPEEYLEPEPISFYSTFVGPRLWTILAWGLVGAVVAVVLGLLLPPSYKATAQLYFDPRDLQVLENQVTPETEAQNIGTTLVRSQALVLRSDNLLRKVVAELHLVDDPEFNGTPQTIFGELAQALKSIIAPGGEDNSPAAVEAVTLENLRRAIGVDLIDRSYIIEASATADERSKASEILSALVDAFLKYQEESRSDVASRTSLDLQGGIERLRLNVEKIEQEIEDYKAENQLTGVGGQIVSERQLSELSTKLIDAQAETAQVKARFDAVLAAKGDLGQLPEAVASETLRELRGLLARLVQQKAVLEAQLQPSHPTMRSLRDSEAKLNSEIKAELTRIGESLRVDYQRAKENEEALSKLVDAERERLKTANQAQITLRGMERRLETARQLYRDADTRASQAREQAELNTANVRVISDPSTLRKKVFPPPTPLLAAMGLVFGLFIGFVVTNWRLLLFRGRGRDSDVVDYAQY